MNYKKIDKDNLTIHLINTSRFKTINVVVFFTREFNKNDIVEYYSAVPYFVQTDNVKSKYTKEELRNIIQEFKIGSQEYKYSDEYVKVMK